MSGCGCSSESTTRNQCGEFSTPSNPDAGAVGPYRQKLDCSAPSLPTPVCDDDEYTTDYDPDDPLRPFRIVSRLFSGSCEVITDGSGTPIMTTLA